MYEAVYFDGLTPQKRPVVVVLQAGGVCFGANDAEMTEYWRFSDLETRAGYQASEALSVECRERPDARLVITDAQLRERLLEHVAALRPKQNALPSHRAWMVWLTLTVVLVGLLLLGARHLARPIVSVMPRSFDRMLGRALGASMPTEQKLGKRADARNLMQGFVKKLDPQGHYDVRLLGGAVVNAFALPGGQIWVYCGIIRKMDSGDELAGVLVHEMAHVRLRHGTESLVRAMGTSIVFGAMLGDVSGFTGGGAQLLETLTSTAYSRAVEQEADVNAMQNLKTAGVRADGLGAFFSRMHKDNKLAEGLSFMSTHPSDFARSRYLKQSSRGRSAFSETEWQMVQKACR